MDEIKQHADIVRQRFTDQNLSIVELRREAVRRHQQLLDPEHANDATILLAEIQVLDELVEAQQPPAPTPQEMVAQLRETNPQAASALEHQLQVQKLQQAIDAAQQFAQDHPTSNDAPKRLEAAQQALAELPPAQYIQEQQQRKQLVEEGEQLVRQSTVALTPAERDALLQQSEERFAAARGEQPKQSPESPAPPAAAPFDPVAYAESLVAQGMAANG